VDRCDAVVGNLQAAARRYSSCFAAAALLGACALPINRLPAYPWLISWLHPTAVQGPEVVFAIYTHRMKSVPMVLRGEGAGEALAMSVLGSLQAFASHLEYRR
jgi:hypothetical protein